MARSKTARQKKGKKGTMRKPRTALRITNNNLNLSEDPNVKYEIMESRMNRAEYRADQEAKERLNAVPKDTFLIEIISISPYNPRRSIVSHRKGRIIEGAYESGKSFNNSFEKLPFRAMDFLRLLKYEEITDLRDYGVIQYIFDNATRFKVLYKGNEQDENYFCLVDYTISPTQDQSEYMEDLYFKPSGFWNVYFLPAIDFFKAESDLIYPSEPDRFFTSRLDVIPFLRGLPHLKEKAEKERSAIQTWRDSLLRHQRRVVEPMAARFMKETKQVVPENVEHIIRSFI
jgi:hypothetical protein